MKKLLLLFLLLPIDLYSQTLLSNGKDCPPGFIKKLDYNHQWKCVEERALPVELLYFKGVQTYEDVTLYWSTSSELNADYYQIEGSNDATIFEPLMRINSKFNTTTQQQYYQQRVRRFKYYRLCQYDLDNSYTVYSVIFIPFRIIQRIEISKYDVIGRRIYEEKN